MATAAVPRDELPRDACLLAEGIAALLDERMATAHGNCRLELQFNNGELAWLRARVHVTKDGLEELQEPLSDV